MTASARGVYRADDILHRYHSAAGRAMMVAPRLTTGNVSIPACQVYVNAVVTTDWFTALWGCRSVEVRHKAHGAAITHTRLDGSFTITLPPWARREATILHELAHVVTPLSCAGHGPEFAHHLWALATHQLGPEAGDRLLRAYRRERVRVV